MSFKKTLKFMYSGLPKDFYLVFTFDEQTIKGHTMYDNLFPVVWKIAHLQAGGEHQFHETYEQRFAVATAEIEDGIVMTSSAVRDMEFKQETVLTGSKESGFAWSTPKEDPSIAGNEFAAKNETGSVQQVAVCSHPKGQFAQPLLYLDASDGGTLLVSFTPRLRCYAVYDMKEGGVIKAQISSKVLFNELLNKPGLPNDWVITYDIPSGNLVITPMQ